MKNFTFSDLVKKSVQSRNLSYNSEWQKYFNYIRKKRPRQPRSLYVAFASSVLNLTRGVSYSPPEETHPGPTLREHLVAYSLSQPDGKVEVRFVEGYGLLPVVIFATGVKRYGEWSCEEAYEHAERIVFGDLTPYRDICETLWLSVFCHNDPEKDVDLLRSWTGCDNRSNNTIPYSMDDVDENSIFSSVAWSEPREE